jgi:flagellar protein FlbT
VYLLERCFVNVACAFARASSIPKYLPTYQGYLRDLRNSNPGDRLTIDAINAHISSGALYKALKEIRKLTKREDALMAA